MQLPDTAMAALRGEALTIAGSLRSRYPLSYQPKAAYY